MTPSDLVGTSYGPASTRITAERVAEFVSATGDDPGRWNQLAPPGYAGALLFSVAPDFLWQKDIAAFTRTLVHVDQSFTYHDRLAFGAAVTVDGRVDRVRERRGAHFVTFLAAMRSEQALLAESASTFLMSDAAATEPTVDSSEPDPLHRGPNERPCPVATVSSGDSLPPLAKSASRADLIRYAAASGDFNPIHWDHATARTAGFPGIIVHGLLMAAWALQVAAAVNASDRPVLHTKLRFRAPLRPAAPALANGTVAAVEEGRANLRLTVTSGDEQLVTGTAVVPVGKG